MTESQPDDQTDQPDDGPADQPDEAEVEEERARRLDPDNRPENAEIDNTDAPLPTVEEFKELNAGEEDEASAGTSDPTKKFREMAPSDEEVAEIEEERERRLDPDNRPENAEVDNTADAREGVDHGG